jgi:hypothetical protein
VADVSILPTDTAAPGDGGSGADESWLDPVVGRVTTPFVTTPGLVTAECVRRDGSPWTVTSR